MNEKERQAHREYLRARRLRRQTGKDIATYPMLINVMQHLTEWGCDAPLYKVHWEGNTLMILYDPADFSEAQLEELRYQQCTPDEEEPHLVMTFAEES